MYYFKQSCANSESSVLKSPGACSDYDTEFCPWMSIGGPQILPAVNEQVKQRLGPYGGERGVAGIHIPTPFLSLDSNVFN